MMRPSNDLPVVYLCRDAVLTLQEQLNLALARRFAARSEKLPPDQIRLFDEAVKAQGKRQGQAGGGRAWR